MLRPHPALFREARRLATSRKQEYQFEMTAEQFLEKGIAMGYENMRR
jgi:hypothetical protein